MEGAERRSGQLIQKCLHELTQGHTAPGPPSLAGRVACAGWTARLIFKMSKNCEVDVRQIQASQSAALSPNAGSAKKTDFVVFLIQVEHARSRLWMDVDDSKAQ